MNRLQRELSRLYLTPPPAQAPAAEPAAGGLVDASGPVRAMVLELARPADWAGVARVWNGVQADLGLPAPAIAVSGSDGYQLWFSLASPLPVAQAAAFLEGLRLRYLADIPRQRLALLPALDDGSPKQARHAPWVPAEQPGGGRWSAFVAPDLAPMFAEEPWLDLAPNPDGQAGLLAHVHSMTLADLQQAQARLGPGPAPAPARPAVAPGAEGYSGPRLPVSARPNPQDVRAGVPDARPAEPPAEAAQDPRRFLFRVMNDPGADLALRVEAAKALLPFFDPHQPP